MSCFVEIGPLVFEKNILKFRQCIFTISLFSPLETEVVLYLNKLDFPSPTDVLCQVWLKLAHIGSGGDDFCYFLDPAQES